MRVLVTWADDRSANLGVRVLARGAAELARQAWGSDIQIDFQDFAESLSGFRPSKDTIVRDLGRRNGPIKDWLSSYDAILDTGAGDSFTDIYGLKRLAVMTYVQSSALKLGIPLLMLPQTIGPFNTRIGKAQAQRTLARAALIAVRDPESARAAAALVGPGKILQSTDVVFSLPAPGGQKPHQDVLLNVSGLLWNPNPHVDNLRYREQLIELSQGLRDRGLSVALFPHVLSNSTQDDDAAILPHVVESLNIDSVIIPENLDDARAMLASTGIVIGSRMHACLNALSCATPAVPWAYSRKFAPLLSDLGWSPNYDLRSSPLIAQDTLRHIDRGLPSALPISIEGRARLTAVVDKLKDGCL